MKLISCLGYGLVLLVAASGCGAESNNSDTEMNESESSAGETDDAPSTGSGDESPATDGSSDGPSGNASNAEQPGNPSPPSPTDIDEQPAEQPSPGDPAPEPGDDPDPDGGPAGDEPSDGDPGLGNDCTDRCPVPRICQPCGDGCAEAYVPCAADGSCGEVQWLCESSEPAPVDPTPVEPGPDPIGGQCPANCPVPALCQLCDDGSCATAAVSCNDDGSCGTIDWQCGGSSDPEPGPRLECRDVSDCPQIAAVCKDCPDGSLVCPSIDCIDNACVTLNSECAGAYDPCAGKANGDSCSLCPPNDRDCIETDEVKACLDGKCVSAVNIAE